MVGLKTRLVYIPIKFLVCIETVHVWFHQDNDHKLRCRILIILIVMPYSIKISYLHYFPTICSIHICMMSQLQSSYIHVVPIRFIEIMCALNIILRCRILITCRQSNQRTKVF